MHTFAEIVGGLPTTKAAKEKLAEIAKGYAARADGAYMKDPLNTLARKLRPKKKSRSKKPS